MKFQQIFSHETPIDDKTAERHYRILADGHDTGITRVYLVEGSASNVVSWKQNELRYGAEKFDMTATDVVGWEEWIIARLPVSQKTIDAASR
jgi:hypothetical protein